jgi:hypothetical protein
MEHVGCPFFEWLTTSPWANAMNGPGVGFPVVESLHFIGFAFDWNHRHY